MGSSFFDSGLTIRYHRLARQTTAKGNLDMYQDLQRLRGRWTEFSPALVPMAVGLCLALAYAAQRTLDQRTARFTALVAYGIAAIAFALLMKNVATEARTGQTDAAERPSPALPVLAASLGSSLSGCLFFGDNRFRPLGLVLWIGGMLATLLYLWLRSPRRASERESGAWFAQRALQVPTHWPLLAAILLIGTWLRFWLLREIPADMGWDLPYNYYDTLTILGGQRPIFFPANLGREGLFFYCLALCARAVGLSQWTLQLTSAILGTATILVVYGLGREAFSRRVGLAAAYLLAVNRWHIILSRSGFRVILMPLFTILVLYTLVRALRRQRFLDFAWAGLALGIGFHTYKAFLFVPLAIALGSLAYVLAKGWSAVRPFLSRVLLMGCVALVALAPLARFTVEHPELYFARERRQLEIMGRDDQAQDSGLLAYYWQSLLGFNSEGDGNSRFNVPLARHMGFVSGMLMVLGLGYALVRWRQGFNSILLSAWFILVLPTAVTMLPNEPANIFRMSGTIGPALVLAALPLWLVYDRIRAVMSHAMLPAHPSDPTPLVVGNDDRREEAPPPGRIISKRKRRLRLSLKAKSATRRFAWDLPLHWTSAVMPIVVIAAMWLPLYELRETNRFYFTDYVAVLPDQANYSIAREMAREMVRHGDLGSAYIKVWPHWFDGNSLRVNLCKDRSYDPEISMLDPTQPPLATIQGSALFILHPDDREAIEVLRSFFPHGVLISRRYPDGTVSFYSFYGER